MNPNIKRLFRQLATRFFELERRDKQILQALADAMAVVAALIAAYLLNGLPIDSRAIAEAAALAPFVVLVMLAAGTYRAVVRYLSFSLSPYALGTVAVGVIGLEVLHGALRDAVATRTAFDFGLILLVLVTLPRQLMRWIYEALETGGHELVAIYGAGSAGRQLATALQSNPKYRIFGFIDEDPGLRDARIMGLPVRGPEWLGEWVEAGVEHILLALPNASITRRREIIASLEPLEISVQTVPDMEDLISGRARVAELRHIEADDLLGRESVPPESDLIARDILGKVVLVTGAGGSIGSELCRQILRQKPATVLMLERSEHALYAIDQELRPLKDQLTPATKLVAILGSVCDGDRMVSICRRYAVETVYHAAAYKHVPLVEANAMAAVENNVRGTWLVAKAAVDAGVESFVLISTDKAVRPTNVMGASKRLAELGVQALAKASGRTRLSIVRFGNVLGSSGSVVPLFRSQIAAGGPVTVTHPDVIRYFMTIPEAAQLVIQAGAMGSHGDVFVLDMGEPVNIKSLAERMIRLSGYRPLSAEQPDGEIEIVITGLRPGEKLYEELLISDNTVSTPHARISRCDEPSLSLEEYQGVLKQLIAVHDRSDLAGLRALLLSTPLEYQPTEHSACDVALEAKTTDKVIEGAFERASA